MKVVFSFLFLSLTIHLVGQNKLIYVGDPMCSWCYGFSPELLEIVEAHKETLQLELVMGGLRPYNKESMTDLKSFLTHHWEDVHKASGQEFSYGILDRSDLVYDTEPPSRAAIVVRELAPEKELTFFKEIQKSFYKDNLDMSHSSSYHVVLKNLEIDTEEFDILYRSNVYKNRIKEDFERARLLGVSSFPTMLVEVDGKATIVARGYAKAEQVIASIDKVISNK